MSRISLAATGDSFITRRLPAGDDSFRQVASIIGKADVRFTNLEVTVHRMEGPPSAQSGGTWAVADPWVLDDLKMYGFNALAWANNHSMDYSYGGLEATSRYLDRYDWVHAGVGRNLAEAGAIKYIEVRGARIALLAATSTFHESWRAGEQRPDVPGRPGVNPLRFSTVYRVSAERLEQLKAIAAETGINDERDLLAKEGFVTKDSAALEFGHHRFEEGAGEGMVTKPDSSDLSRLLRTVQEARRQADYVFVSIHSHEMRDGRKDLPAQFLTEFSRACIDEGAHAVMGHGPHIIRGVELYKGKPILYSLGNFIFQNDAVTRLPADYYEKYGLGHEHNTADALDARSANNTRGLGVNPDVWSSVIAELSFGDGMLTQMTFHPIELGFGEPRYRRGWPRLTDDTQVLYKLQKLSRELGMELTIEGAQACWKAQ
ncbi:CapA family protein [Paenibacillus koleovorans]|uniref:CapA family protein n=1 Tax=Paenibacillus koleovorans TaxID=121608 RepID=UPI0035A25FF0